MNYAQFADEELSAVLLNMSDATSTLIRLNSKLRTVQSALKRLEELEQQQSNFAAEVLHWKQLYERVLEQAKSLEQSVEFWHDDYKAMKHLADQRGVFCKSLLEDLKGVLDEYDEGCVEATELIGALRDILQAHE